MKLRLFAAQPFTLLAVLAFGVLLLTACGKQEAKSSGATSPSTSGASAGSVDIEIAENDNGFVPKVVVVVSGQLVRITFVNQGKALHNLRIAGPNGQFGGPGDTVAGQPLVSPGESATVEWKAPSQPGQFAFRCDLHPEHTGVITVR
jgi:plastocyanin